MSEPPENPYHDHGACRALTAVTLAHVSEAGFGPTRRWSRGARIWTEGDATDTVFLLKTGKVGVTDSRKRENDPQIFSAGQSFGELCFCSQVRRSTARALTVCEALLVSYADLLDWISGNRDRLHRAVYNFCTRLSSADQRIEVLAHRGAQERIGTLLIQLASKSASEDGTAILGIKHEDLSEMAVMSRAHVTVTMGRFREMGLIRYSRNEPLTVDKHALSRFVRRGA